MSTIEIINYEGKLDPLNLFNSSIKEIISNPIINNILEEIKNDRYSIEIKGPGHSDRAHSDWYFDRST